MQRTVFAATLTLAGLLTAAGAAQANDTQTGSGAAMSDQTSTQATTTGGSAQNRVQDDAVGSDRTDPHSAVQMGTGTGSMGNGEETRTGKTGQGSVTGTGSTHSN